MSDCNNNVYDEIMKMNRPSISFERFLARFEANTADYIVWNIQHQMFANTKGKLVHSSVMPEMNYDSDDDDFIIGFICMMIGNFKSLQKIATKHLKSPVSLPNETDYSDEELTKHSKIISEKLAVEIVCRVESLSLDFPDELALKFEREDCYKTDPGVARKSLYSLHVYSAGKPGKKEKPVFLTTIPFIIKTKGSERICVKTMTSPEDQKTRSPNRYIQFSLKDECLV